MAYIDERAFPNRAAYVAAIRAIASYQWVITVCFLACFVLTPVGFVFIIFAVRLMRALRLPAVLVVLGAVGMFVPVVNVVILGVLNIKASTALRAAGLRVGALGVDPYELQELEWRLAER